MSNYLKPRKLKGSLLSGSNNSPAIELTVPQNVQLLAVVRTKGGSGEKHLVKALSQALLDKHKRVFICLETYIKSNDLLLTYNYSNPLNKLIDIEKIPESQGGFLNLNWRFDNNLEKLFSILKHEKNVSIIFTCNTSGAGEMESRIKQLERFCDQIYMSVCIDTHESITPAKGFCENPTVDQSKITFGCWLDKSTDEKKLYHLALVSSKEFRTSDLSKIKHKARLPNINL
ncbi:hypothetical protein WDB89_11650 [Pseudoalteromonas sp. B5MOD-1]